ncbi:MAG: site-specific integrase [Eubacterium sp.]|nr:site-specific integrase [Eubacterium sp.]
MMNNKKQYTTSIYVGTVNGKAQRKFIRANSQRELNKKVNALKSEVAAGKDVYTTALFGQWADKWLDEKKKPSEISNSTLKEYQNEIKQLNLRYKNVELKKIKLSDFQVYINELAENSPLSNKPLARTTLQKIVNTASAVCKYARANDIPAPDFFEQVIIPKSAPKDKRRALTEQEQQMIIDTPHRCQPAAMILLFSGLRRGELVPLKWSDIDLQNGIISVTKSADLNVSPPKIKQGGKTANAVRQVPIPPILVDYLIEYKQQAKILTPYVCYNAGGKLLSGAAFRQMWDSYLIDLNVKYGYAKQNVSKYNPKGLPMRIERFTPHYLRHTYATILYLQGVDMVTAKQYLGHSDIQTTINIYTDLENNSKISLSDSYKKKLKREYKIKTA